MSFHEAGLGHPAYPITEVDPQHQSLSPAVVALINNYHNRQQLVVVEEVSDAS